MCGIAGVLNRADYNLVETMVRSIQHRGPDGTDWAVVGKYSVGGSRLAIRGDPAASAVFRDDRTGAVVLLNGEIYNVEALRGELRAGGWMPRTDLEAEVVARLYETAGIGFAERLEGMFAAAVLDGDRLVLARDRFGIKPLYYAEIGDEVAFGSEIKAVLAHPGVHREINTPALDEIAVFGYVCTLDETPFRGIRQVEPGTAMVFDRAGKQALRFGDLPTARYLGQGEPLEYERRVAAVRAQLIGAVRVVLEHGSQPKGLYLSGGVDSTTIAVIASAILGYSLHTFTLTDGEGGTDLEAAGRVAQRLGTSHIVRRVTVEDYLNALEDFTYHYEMPLAGGVFDIHGAMAFHLLSETVSQHVKVAISGEGADELFGGYYWIYTHPLGFSDRIRSRTAALESASRVHRIVDGLFPQPEDEMVYRRNLLDALLRTGLANYHLQSVDRSCGAYGFEVRPVYLEDGLAKMVAGLPIECKVPDKRTTKRILKDAFRPEFEALGLEWVLQRCKEGMPGAVATIGARVQETLEERVSDRHLAEHPLRRRAGAKLDAYLLDLFLATFGIEVPCVA